MEVLQRVNLPFKLKIFNSFPKSESLLSHNSIILSFPSFYTPNVFITMTSPVSTLVRPNDKLEHALLSAWLNAADVGICVVDSSLSVVVLNPAACYMLGVNGLEMLNQPFKNLVSTVKFQPGIAQWLATPGYEGSRHATITRGKAEVDLLFKATNLRGDVAMSLGVKGDVTFKIMAITDISELLQAQREVGSQAFKRQWQALNAGVVISDARLPDMPIVYVNPMFESMSGYESSEVLGRNCRFLQGKDVNQPGLLKIRKAISEQANGYAKLRNYRKDGSPFMNELFISPVKDGSGTVTHFVGIQHLETAASTLGEL
jgi:PAS domain S-box-containing protein